MSRPARWDMATGRLNRQAAALSGKVIRACVRIAAGALPGDHRLGKGVITSSIPGFCSYASWSSSPRLRPPPYRGANAPIFPHFACGGPLGHPQSGDRSSSSHTSELIGRQPHNDALRQGVQLLKFTHRISLQLVSRASALPGPSRRDLRNVSAPRVVPKMTQERLHAGQKEFARGASHEFG